MRNSGFAFAWYPNLGGWRGVITLVRGLALVRPRGEERGYTGGTLSLWSVTWVRLQQPSGLGEGGWALPYQLAAALNGGHRPSSGRRPVGLLIAPLLVPHLATGWEQAWGTRREVAPCWAIPEQATPLWPTVGDVGGLSAAQWSIFFLERGYFFPTPYPLPYPGQPRDHSLLRGRGASHAKPLGLPPRGVNQRGQRGWAALQARTAGAGGALGGDMVARMGGGGAYVTLPTPEAGQPTAHLPRPYSTLGAAALVRAQRREASEHHQHGATWVGGAHAPRSFLQRGAHLQPWRLPMTMPVASTDGRPAHRRVAGYRREAERPQASTDALRFNFQSLSISFYQPQVRYRPGFAGHWRQHRRRLRVHFSIMVGQPQKALTRYVAKVQRLASFGAFRLAQLSLPHLLRQVGFSPVGAGPLRTSVSPTGWVSLNGRRVLVQPLQLYAGDFVSVPEPALRRAWRVVQPAARLGVVGRPPAIPEPSGAYLTDAPQHLEVDELVGGFSVVWEPARWLQAWGQGWRFLPVATWRLYNWKYVT